LDAAQVVRALTVLVVSELVANSVRHSGALAGAVVDIWIALTETTVCLEVVDPMLPTRTAPAGSG
jgi:anti-sigma regulatory factor (Ser/Thr protein kinase)